MENNIKEYKKECIYMYNESLCCTAEITTLQINYTSIKKRERERNSKILGRLKFLGMRD